MLISDSRSTRGSKDVELAFFTGEQRDMLSYYISSLLILNPYSGQSDPEEDK